MRSWSDLRRRPELGEGLLVALLVALFYFPLWNLRAIPAGGDGANLFYPLKVLVEASIWHQGVVPLWNPFSYLGHPLAASLQHAVFYPVDRLLFALVPVASGMHLAVLMHLLGAGLGCWSWLRFGLRISGGAAVVAGTAFPCCAWFWGHIDHINQIATAAWMPWLVLLGWCLTDGRLGSMRFGLLYALAAALQFLAGHPQEAFLSHLLVVALVGGRIAVRPDRRAATSRAGAGFLAAAVLGGLLAAVQLLPALELSSHSRRQIADPAYPFFASMPPNLLWTYLDPHAFGSFAQGYFAPQENGELVWDLRAYGEYGLYVGWPILLLALAGAAAQRRRWLPWGLVLAGIVALLLAMGGNTDPRRLLAGAFSENPAPGWSLYDIYLLLVPPARSFRVPARFALLTAFALVTLAALGLEAITQRLAASGPRRLALGSLGALVFAALLIPARKEKFHFPGPLPQEPLAENWTLDNRLFRLTLSDDDWLVRERMLPLLEPFGGSTLPLRWTTKMPHLNAAQAVPLVAGYEEGLVPTLRYHDFLWAVNRNLRNARPDPSLLALLGVGRIWTDLGVDPGLYPPAQRSGILAGAEHVVPVARGAAIYQQAIRGVDLSSLEGPWWNGGEALESFSTVPVAFGQLDPERWDSWQEFRLATELPSVNRVTVRRADGQPLPAGARGDAFLAMGWFPGWTVGEGQTVEWVNAVHAYLPAQASTGDGWELRYEPAAYRVGAFLSAFGLCCWCALWRRAQWRRVTTCT